MKTLILLTTLILLAVTSFSQEVRIVSNPCNPASEQAYPFQYAEWSNTPDIMLPQNIIQAELVLANDGTTSGVFTNIGTPPISVETTTDACETGTWTQDLTGKIAVIWRGLCEFSCKAENAQNRGAIGVVIINHTGTAIGMAEGVCGANVTIPVVMIARQDGEDLMNCIVGGGVIAFIGNTNGLLPNNMSSSIADILMPESSAMPWDLAQNGTEYPVEFGIWAYNNGYYAQNGVTATVDVVYNGSSVYNQTSAPVDFTAPDTTYLDSNYFDLGTYAPALWNVGTYVVTYTINDTNDQDLSDNIFSFEFKFTNNEDIYAKCRLDSLNLPKNPVRYTASWLEADNWATCLSFRNASAGQRNTQVLGMTFSAFIAFLSDSTMINKSVEIKCYQWNDVFSDIYSPPTYNNIIELESKPFIYTSESQNGENIYLSFDNVISLQDNQRYLFCLHNINNNDLKIGFDNQIDYTTTSRHYLQPLFPLDYVELGYPNQWFTDGFGLDAVPAISVTMDISTNVNEAKKESTFYPYPNPAANLLTVPLRQRIVGNIKVEVFDVLGKVVLSENQVIGNEPLKVNVAAIENGNYLFKLTFVDGTSDVFKVSVNK